MQEVLTGLTIGSKVAKPILAARPHLIETKEQYAEIAGILEKLSNGNLSAQGFSETLAAATHSLRLFRKVGEFRDAVPVEGGASISRRVELYNHPDNVDSEYSLAVEYYEYPQGFVRRVLACPQILAIYAAPAQDKSAIGVVLVQGQVCGFGIEAGMLEKNQFIALIETYRAAAGYQPPKVTQQIPQPQSQQPQPAAASNIIAQQLQLQRA